MTDLLEELRERMAALPAEKRERIRRELSGQASEDLIRRGDVVAVIRRLRGTAPPLEYQNALRDVQRGVSELDPPAARS